MASPSPLMTRRAFAGVLGGAALLALGEGILYHAEGVDLMPLAYSYPAWRYRW